MTSAVTSSAISVSRAPFEFGFPYQGPQFGRIHLRRHPRHGLDVIVGIERGQILCNSYSGCTVNVRFDDGEVRRYSAVEPESNDSTMIFLRNSRDFIRRLKAAERVLIELQIYQESPVLLEFDASGLNEEKWPHG